MNEFIRFLAGYHTDHEFSDAHLEQGKILRVRAPGGWIDPGFGMVGEERLIAFLNSLEPQWKSKLKTAHSINLAVSVGTAEKPLGRYRCSVYTIDGERRVAISIRKIKEQVFAIERLGLPPAVLAYTTTPRGLLLVTGATGSGKTTTIMSLLQCILEKRNAHVSTIEDPIEYILDSHEGIVSQREIGIDVDSYANGVRDALRQRPDVIMIGEVRDAETATIAVQAGESGHFVPATVHARSAIGAIQKMRRMLTEDGHLAYTLSGVLAQALVPSKQGSNFILASEYINLGVPEVQMKVQKAQWGELEEYIKRGEGGCLWLNASLANLVKQDSISKESALMATYDRVGLMQVFNQNPSQSK